MARVNSCPPLYFLGPDEINETSTGANLNFNSSAEGAVSRNDHMRVKDNREGHEFHSCQFKVKEDVRLPAAEVPP
jgi:hypothetical protein